jgi:hypothetical protein
MVEIYSVAVENKPRQVEDRKEEQYKLWMSKKAAAEKNSKSDKNNKNNKSDKNKSKNPADRILDDWSSANGADEDEQEVAALVPVNTQAVSAGSWRADEGTQVT